MSKIYTWFIYFISHTVLFSFQIFTWVFRRKKKSSKHLIPLTVTNHNFSLKLSGVFQILTPPVSSFVEDYGNSSCLWPLPSYLLHNTRSETACAMTLASAATKGHQFLHTFHNIKSFPSTVHIKSKELKYFLNSFF